MTLVRVKDNFVAVYNDYAAGITAIPDRRYVPNHFQGCDDCDCTLCVEWRLRRSEVERIQPMIEGHRSGNCTCSACTIGRQIHVGMHSVTSRRDLWSEMSFHAYNNADYRRDPLAVMRAVCQEIEDPKRRTNWWAFEGGRLTLGYWFNKINARLAVNV